MRLELVCGHLSCLFKENQATDHSRGGGSYISPVIVVTVVCCTVFPITALHPNYQNAVIIDCHELTCLIILWVDCIVYDYLERVKCSLLKETSNIMRKPQSPRSETTPSRLSFPVGEGEETVVGQYGCVGRDIRGCELNLIRFSFALTAGDVLSQTCGRLNYSPFLSPRRTTARGPSNTLLCPLPL